MTSTTPAKFKEIAIEDPAFSAPASPQRTKLQFDIDPDLGVMKMSSVHNRYFSIGDNYAEFRHDVMLRPLTRPAHLGIAIMTGTRGVVKFDNREWVEVKNGQTYLTFNPGVEEVHQFSPGEPMRSIFLDIDPTYFSNLLIDQQPAKGSSLCKLRDRVLNNEFVGELRAINSTAFHNTIASMLNCPLEGSLGNLMLEGALQQLLSLQLSMVCNEGSGSGIKPISSRDRDIIIAVKEHLDATFNEDHSILDLSRTFGINQNKLKTLFRETFGVPVITYLFDKKMDHARNLLFDKGMYVGEVAAAIGYRNANHFATAFKRKFGINPSRLKA